MEQQDNIVTKESTKQGVVLYSFLGVLFSLVFISLIIYACTLYNLIYPLLIGLVLLPIFGWYQKKKKFKYFGKGILIGYVVILSLLFLLYLIVSNLH